MKICFFWPFFSHLAQKCVPLPEVGVWEYVVEVPLHGLALQVPLQLQAPGHVVVGEAAEL